MDNIQALIDKYPYPQTFKHDRDTPCSLDTLCREEPEWATSRIRTLHAQLAAANERAGKLEKNLRALCERLDEWWYEADPMDDVKKGERHPWTVAARKALEVPDAPLPD